MQFKPRFSRMICALGIAPGGSYAQVAAAQIPGMFQPPPDVVEDASDAPAGTVMVDVRDADNAPFPNLEVRLGVLRQSVAKGDSRSQETSVANDLGKTRFDHLVIASNIGYRVGVAHHGALYQTAPFQLRELHGMHVVLHVYPVTRNIHEARVVMQTDLYFELRDDRIQFQQIIGILNFGRVTWVPDHAVASLPVGYTALTSSETIDDVGVEATDGHAIKLHGSFSPGRHEINFQWQLPHDGEDRMVADVGLPPNSVSMNVVALASQKLKLVVDGFPPPESRMNPTGQHLWVTKRYFRPDEPAMDRIHIELRDIPTPGPWRLITSAVTALIMLCSIVWFRRKPLTGQRSARNTIEERDRLLEELEELERARRRGDVGPRTYEHARYNLINAIAETLQAPQTSA